MENEIIVNGVTYVRKEEKKQSKRGNKYWFIDNDGEIVNSDSEVTDKRKPFVSPTEADCTKARDKMLALYRIKEYCNDQWGEFIPDWSDADQEKRYVYYAHRYNWYTINTDYYCESLNQIYLAYKNHCVEIIEKFKDDLDILFDKVW